MNKETQSSPKQYEAGYLVELLADAHPYVSNDALRLKIGIAVEKARGEAEERSLPIKFLSDCSILSDGFKKPEGEAQIILSDSRTVAMSKITGEA
jgi:hypothetical protein